MINIGNKAIDTLYVGGRLVQQAWLGGKKIYPAEGQIPERIKESMVLWYDTVRQGCTNESMSANPVLTDLSGNGHDAECRNFAWTEQSGISTADYPGALVSDGVDDRVFSQGFGDLENFTVLFKAEFLTDTTDYSGIVRSNTFYFYARPNNVGVFIKNVSNVYNVDKTVYGLDSDNNIYTGAGNDIYPYEHTQQPVNSALDIFYNAVGSSGNYTKMALWNFIMFDRVLTQDEVGWVKTNLIGG